MEEQSRLEVVRQFGELNLAYDRELQQMVSLAAKLCHTPISYITLIDADTQWIKVSKGLATGEMPREISFCTHTIKHNRPLVVNDTSGDERFCRHPLVTGEPGVRFYAGVPLVTRGGHRIGTLCAMDFEPRELTAQQLLLLKIMARHTVRIMELKLSLDQLDKSIAGLKEVRSDNSAAGIRLRSMFESLTDFYFLLGEDGEIIDFNRNAYDFVKSTFRQSLTYGRFMTDFMTPGFRDVFPGYFRQAMAGESLQTEQLADYGSKGKIWWDCIFQPVRDQADNVIGVSFVARNVTARKLSEEKLREKNRLLSRIAEIQSHEYRAPVASILGLMSLIEEADYQPPKEYLVLLGEAVKQLDEKIRAVVKLANDPALDL